jgi:hypothetical protein
VTAPLSASWWTAIAPGAPGQRERPLTLVRALGASGGITSVWSWRGAVSRVETVSTGLLVARSDGAVHEHRSSDSGWAVDVVEAGARRRIELGPAGSGVDVRPDPETIGEPRAAHPAPRRLELPATFSLGEAHYRRSELPWSEAGSPSAHVSVQRQGDELVVRVTVPGSHRRFVPVEAENPYDNEPAATNGDGVQLYVRAGDREAGWLLVPRAGSGEVGARPVESWNRDFGVDAAWEALPAGYALVARIALASATELGLDVVVNETAPGRERRRGQLVLSGAAGEFVYLRGDRHDASRLLRFSFADD